MQELTEPLIDDPSVRAVAIASAKPDGFIAGADVKIVQRMSAADAHALSRDGNRLLQRVATSKKPPTRLYRLSATTIRPGYSMPPARVGVDTTSSSLNG